jgi:Xaa-Pro aminopeptidase
MSPSQIRTQTLAELRQTLRAMMSPAWDLALEGRPRAEVTQAARTLLAVQRARLRLENAELAEIREALVANDVALTQGIATLDRALRRISNVTAVLAAAGGLLRTVGRVIDLAT